MKISNSYKINHTNVRLIVLCLAFLCYFNVVKSQSQSDELRIAQIKTLYKNAQQYLEGATNCRESVRVDKIPYSEFFEDTESNEMIEFEHKVKKCLLPDNLSVITAHFSDWEWGEDISYFLENGKIFFVFDREYDVAGEIETRIYFDTSGRVIRILSKSNYETGEMSENIQEKDPKEIQRINDFILEQYQKAQNILN